MKRIFISYRRQVRWPTWAVSIAVVVAIVIAVVVLFGVIDALGPRESSVDGDEIDPSATPPAIAADEGLDYSLQPSYGDVSLTAGFPSDPHRMDLTSGGAVSVAYLNDQQCTGFASVAPSYRVKWSGTTAALRIFFVAAANVPDGDTTLLVNRPDKTWACNDDAEEGERDPLVVLQNPAAGHLGRQLRRGRDDLGHALRQRDRPDTRVDALIVLSR